MRSAPIHSPNCSHCPAQRPIFGSRSATFKAPSRTVLPNGHPRFIVFCRDAAMNILDRAGVRIVAKIAREFSAEAKAGMTHVRNVLVVRSSPMPDSPDMYELHSEDPTLELTPGPLRAGSEEPVL